MCVTGKDLVDVLEFVAGSLTDVWIWDKDNPVYKGRAFGHRVNSARGGLACWNDLENGCVDLMLSLNGNCLAGSDSLRTLLRITSYLSAMNGKFTRYDINMDSACDFFKGLRDLMDKAYDKKQQKGYGITRWQVEKRKGKVCKTLYLGTRKSDKLHRLYDKDGYIRWELECKNEISQKFVSLAVTAFEAMGSDADFCSIMGTLIKDTILGSVDYIERKDKNLSRGKRLGWWECFIEFVNGCPMTIKRDKRKRLLEKTMAWIERSVMPTLSIINGCSPTLFSDWMINGIKNARRLMSDSGKGRILLEQWEPEGLESLFVGRFEGEHNLFSMV
jgi:hypothetical protein